VAHGASPIRPAVFLFGSKNYRLAFYTGGCRAGAGIGDLIGCQCRFRDEMETR
jgi:hypothetical protein